MLLPYVDRNNKQLTLFKDGIVGVNLNLGFFQSKRKGNPLILTSSSSNNLPIASKSQLNIERNNTEPTLTKDCNPNEE
ncbi:hypothetical protein L6452_06068 [Arctium lappa]|uniref:Uncharacterized protein n=1 Tax=Arctium lappa TaxID=4217 RepID=A0ACB9EIT7_ARCLA|nr:hypothetical protein L6452_06068 [Arctium lappa]